MAAVYRTPVVPKKAKTTKASFQVLYLPYRRSGRALRKSRSLAIAHDDIMLAREHIFGAQHFRAADFAKRDRFHVGGRARDREPSLCRSFFFSATTT
jgi:hypothetical protein